MSEMKRYENFINPYNFIRFPAKKAGAYTDVDTHTGVIEYTITTKTPLFIPNTCSENAFRVSDMDGEHKLYDFFSYTDLDPKRHYNGEYHIPVIPGSAIRGVVRNVYETLTDSCMGILNEEEYPVKRTGEKFTSALLHRTEDGKIELCKAISVRIGTASQRGKNPEGFEQCVNGKAIYYSGKIGPSDVLTDYRFDRSARYRERGYLIKWGMGVKHGKGVKKARYHIFVPDDGKGNGNTILSVDIIKRKLYPVLESYLSQPALQAENRKAYEDYKTDLDRFLKQSEPGFFPVNYSKLAGLKSVFYLAPAVYSKEVSDHNIGELAGQFAPCRDQFCPACELFGHIGGNNTEACSSKIRFSDLYVAKERKPKDYYAVDNITLDALDNITLDALGEPKLGNVDFYLKRPGNATFWTYDYNVQNGKLTEQRGELRGRKYYWHHREVNLHKKVKGSKLNKTIRPVRTNITFRGKVFFESISEKQLNQLIWILNCGTEKLGLKLGGAKPLGYGSVSCIVEQVIERCISCEDGKLCYEMKEIPFEKITYEKAMLSESVKNEFYKIAGLETVPEGIAITYPRTKGQREDEVLTNGYEWFSNNHTTVSGKGMAKDRSDMKIERALPGILTENFSLPYNEKPGKSY